MSYAVEFLFRLTEGLLLEIEFIALFDDTLYPLEETVYGFKTVFVPRTALYS